MHRGRKKQGKKPDFEDLVLSPAVNIIWSQNQPEHESVETAGCQVESKWLKTT